ncbi:MAG: thioredoxin domain-containing protein [Gemmatimonadaceae bacterium]|nr:thioredoxin domain-containing protein [Gemmatimonadaceae bacterium]
MTTAIGSRLERIALVVLCAAAVTVAAALAKREFGGQRSPPDGSIPEVVLMTNWEHLTAVGHTEGRADARVKVVEFGDLECPYCKRSRETMKVILARYGDRVSHTFVHYPLPSHRFARPAARAAECAGAQDRFSAMVDEVYRKQDSLGLKSWTSYAADAGVLDTAEFKRCIQGIGDSAAERGLRAGRPLGVRGTPTILVNGLRFYGAVPEPALVRTIDSLLARK